MIRFQIGSDDRPCSTVRRETLLRRIPCARFWSFGFAALVLTVLYSAHLAFCQRSALPFLDDAFVNSDMHANLLWASSIREQGWLNPFPPHPWNDWMQSIAPYQQWVVWWGGEKIFQQSPLYAYLLSLFLHKLFLMRVLQALMSMGTCVFIGLLTARISGCIAGWIAFWLAALYAPFFGYSWPFLRDGLGWFITAVLLWILSELTDQARPYAHARLFGWLAGVLLGLGFLAKEAYLLFIPVVWAALAGFAWKRGSWDVVLRVVVLTVLTISPLLVRNFLVKAPLLSSSNRLAEAIVLGNADGAHPVKYRVVPVKTRQILYATQAQPKRALLASIASHPDGVSGWLRLELLKLFCLLDPYESPDNLSLYFMACVSPLVRLGLRYWMILAPALVGLFLSVWRRERAQFWLWLFLPVTLVNLLVGVPLSRYRQSLMVLFIPWAAYFLAFMANLFRRRELHHAACWGVALLVAWGLILGPLSWQPPALYERPDEYMVSMVVYDRLGEEQKVQEILALVGARFPGLQQWFETDPNGRKSNRHGK